MKKLKYSPPSHQTAIWGLALSLVVPTAISDTFTGSSSGQFVNPVGAGVGGPFVTGVGTDTFSWGDGSAFGSPPSSLHFSGAAFSGLDDGEIFPLGTLEFFNGTIAGGTEASAVDLAVSLTFTTPAGLSEDFTFNFQLINRANTSDPVESADSVLLDSYAPTEFFTFGGVDYTLKMAFGQAGAGGFTEIDEFFVFEGQSARANLIGQITSDLSSTPPPVIPEASTYLSALALTALTGGFLLRRRKSTV